MSHTSRDSKKLLSRVRRLGGQVAALESALSAGAECTAVLVQVAAIRGAAAGLLRELLTEHLQEHVVAQSDRKRREQEMTAVAELLRSYLK
ncbi:MAG TPA: metal/formaldehyde-sensitive transcriptional repressor [Tahibacter sp.]|jgi:DNA-binding FrmR family transcriptional regulator|nr:metal/formaldehyde-sensitive transcriptional repressor [Tahibacter sp.]